MPYRHHHLEQHLSGRLGEEVGGHIVGASSTLPQAASEGEGEVYRENQVESEGERLSVVVTLLSPCTHPPARHHMGGWCSSGSEGARHCDTAAAAAPAQARDQRNGAGAHLSMSLAERDQGHGACAHLSTFLARSCAHLTSALRT